MYRIHGITELVSEDIHTIYCDTLKIIHFLIFLQSQTRNYVSQSYQLFPAWTQWCHLEPCTLWWAYFLNFLCDKKLSFQKEVNVFCVGWFSGGNRDRTFPRIPEWCRVHWTTGHRAICVLFTRYGELFISLYFYLISL